MTSLHYEYHLNYFCVHDQELLLTTLFLSIIMAMILLNIYLIIESRKVKREIIIAKYNQNQTYCIFNLRIL